MVALFDPLDRSFSIYSLFFVRINERARRLSRMIRIFDEGFIGKNSGTDVHINILEEGE